MWPTTIDMTRDECRGVLRRLELETYSSVVSTFRAQGSLNDQKTKILNELRTLFHITPDRHKAEARRAANDEKLCTIADLIFGPNTNNEWTKEGRRTYPLLPRSAPFTALYGLANDAANLVSIENDQLPYPSDTTRNRAELPQESANASVKMPVTQNPNKPTRSLKPDIFRQTSVTPATKKRNIQPQLHTTMQIQQLYHSHSTSKSIPKQRKTPNKRVTPAKALKMSQKLQQQKFMAQNPTGIGTIPTGSVGKLTKDKPTKEKRNKPTKRQQSSGDSNEKTIETVSEPSTSVQQIQLDEPQVQIIFTSPAENMSGPTYRENVPENNMITESTPISWEINEPIEKPIDEIPVSVKSPQIQSPTTHILQQTLSSVIRSDKKPIVFPSPTQIYTQSPLSPTPVTGDGKLIQKIPTVDLTKPRIISQTILVPPKVLSPTSPAPTIIKSFPSKGNIKLFPSADGKVIIKTSSGDSLPNKLQKVTAGQLKNVLIAPSTATTNTKNVLVNKVKLMPGGLKKFLPRTVNNIGGGVILKPDQIFNQLTSTGKQIIIQKSAKDGLTIGQNKVVVLDVYPPTTVESMVGSDKNIVLTEDTPVDIIETSANNNLYSGTPGKMEQRLPVPGTKSIQRFPTARQILYKPTVVKRMKINDDHGMMMSGGTDWEQELDNVVSPMKSIVRSNSDKEAMNEVVLKETYDEEYIIEEYVNSDDQSQPDESEQRNKQPTVYSDGSGGIVTDDGSNDVIDSTEMIVQALDDSINEIIVSNQSTVTEILE